MLVCPKCNTENRIGTIFCRDCGEKLDVADMRAQKRSERGGGRGRKLIRLVVSLVILGVIAYVAIALFTPVETIVGTVPPDRAETVWRNYRRVVEETPGVSGEQFVLNSAEATALFNRILAFDKNGFETGAGALVPEKIIIELLSGNRVKAIIRYNVFGRLISDTMLIGRIEVVQGSNRVRFHPESYQLGQLSMKWRFQTLVTGRFHQQFSGRPDLEKAIGLIQELEISNNRARIVIKDFHTGQQQQRQPARSQHSESHDLGEVPNFR